MNGDDLIDWGQRAHRPPSLSSPMRDVYMTSSSPSPLSPLTTYRSPRRSPIFTATSSKSPRMLAREFASMNRLKKVSDYGMNPRSSSQPPLRRANPEGGYISPLQAATCHLPQTYRICNPNFNYLSSRNPRRVLTKPSVGVKNDGNDNEDSDYILYVNDILGIDEGHKYLILDVLGQGTFGQVVKCQNMKTLEVVAVKVIKNKSAYFNQSMMEVTILDLLNNKLDQKDEHHILRLKDTFIHKQHLCLVFELLSVNLYELIKQNQFRGLSTNLVRVFATQLLNAMTVLNEAKIIHCDLKPENILLKNLETPNIKVIDFGSACHERQTVYTYIQSRFYRSPEVLLGLPYSASIDTWSLGCIVAELFLGLPLFPGSSEYNQMCRITEMLGQPPSWMLEMGKQSGEFFEKSVEVDVSGKKRYRLKSLEQYSREHSTTEQPSKKYFQDTTLTDIIMKYPYQKKNMADKELAKENQTRIAFVDFVSGLLNLNPLERWSPQQAKLHPFITGERFTGTFVPPMFRPIKKPSAQNPLPPPPSHHNQAPQQKAAEKLMASQAIVHEKAEALALADQQKQSIQPQHQSQPQHHPQHQPQHHPQHQPQYQPEEYQNQIQQQPPVPHVNSTIQIPGPYDPNPYLQPYTYGHPSLGLYPHQQSPMHYNQYATPADPTYQYSSQQNTPQMYYPPPPPPALAQQSQQQQIFRANRARASTQGNIDVPINLQRQAAILGPGMQGSPNWQPGDMGLGMGQGSGEMGLRRGSIHTPKENDSRRDSSKDVPQYFQRWV